MKRREGLSDEMDWDTVDLSSLEGIRKDSEMRFIRVDDRTRNTVDQLAERFGVNADFFAAAMLWSWVATWSDMMRTGDVEGAQGFMDGMAVCLGIVSLNGHDGSPHPGQDVDIAIRVHPFPASRMPGEAAN